jgi:hypothetical protein
MGDRTLTADQRSPGGAALRNPAIVGREEG